MLYWRVATVAHSKNRALPSSRRKKERQRDRSRSTNHRLYAGEKKNEVTWGTGGERHVSAGGEAGADGSLLTVLSGQGASRPSNERWQRQRWREEEGIKRERKTR